MPGGQVEKQEQQIDGPRGTRPEEYQGLVQLVSTVFSPGLDAWLPMLFNQKNLENLRIIVVDGKPVSHVGIASGDASLAGCRVGIGRIGCVATYEEYRGRGYATLLMEDAMKKMDAEEMDLMMVSGGRGLYRRINCADAGTEAVAELQGGPLFPAPPEIETRPVGPDDLDFLRQAYFRKAAHFVRTREHMATLLSGAAGLHSQQSQLVITRRGRRAAYAILGWRKGHEKGHVREHGGEAVALLDGLRAAMVELSLSLARLTTGWWDQDLLQEIRRREVTLEWDYAGGTMKILNPQRFLKRMRPLITRKVGKAVADGLTVEGTPDDLTLRLGEESVRLQGQHIAQFFFGTPDNREKAWLPKAGPMRQALETILPIPRPLYEMDYV